MDIRDLNREQTEILEKNTSQPAQSTTCEKLDEELENLADIGDDRDHNHDHDQEDKPVLITIDTQITNGEQKQTISAVSNTTVMSEIAPKKGDSLSQAELDQLGISMVSDDFASEDLDHIKFRNLEAPHIAQFTLRKSSVKTINLSISSSESEDKSLLHKFLHELKKKS